MSRFRDEMRIGRAILHQTMGDGALIFALSTDEIFELDDDGERVLPEPMRVQVRVHEKYLAEGDLKGTNYHYAEVEDNSPVAVFWLNDPSDFRPKRGMYFITEYGRGYRIDSVFPADDQTQNAKVIEMTASDMVGWPAY